MGECRCPACNPMHASLINVNPERSPTDPDAPLMRILPLSSRGRGMGAMKRDQAANSTTKKTGRGHGNGTPRTCMLCSGTQLTTVERANRYLTHLREN